MSKTETVADVDLWAKRVLQETILPHTDQGIHILIEENSPPLSLVYLRTAVAYSLGDAALFGAVTRLVRVSLGISINRMARRVGVDPSYISRLENQEREALKAVVLDEWAQKLELPLHAKIPLFVAARHYPFTNHEDINTFEYETNNASRNLTNPLFQGIYLGLSAHLDEPKRFRAS